MYNHIRGLIPNPTGYALLDGKKVKFHKVRMRKDDKVHTPGEIEGMIENGYAISAQNGYILVDEIQMEGKAKTDAKSFYNGSGKQLIHKIFNGK